MAPFMPPWLDWLDWLKWDSIGAGIVGKLLGLWFRACLSVVKELFRFMVGGRRDSAKFISNHRNFGASTQQWSLESPSIGKLGKIVLSTLFTLILWRVITWKLIWTAAGEDGDRILTAILLLTSASWVISLAWISFSKSNQKKIAARGSPLQDRIK